MHGRSCTRRDGSHPTHCFGPASSEISLELLDLLLVLRIFHWKPFHRVAFTGLMHISLARACECSPQEDCIFTKPICGKVQASVFAYLSRPEAQRVLTTCILLFSDQKDILLSRTEQQLDLCLSSYSVPTPPLQAFLLPVVPGQGGVWDLDTVSSSSSPSPYQDAMEEEDIDALQVG